MDVGSSRNRILSQNTPPHPPLPSSVGRHNWEKARDRRKISSRISLFYRRTFLFLSANFSPVIVIISSFSPHSPSSDAGSTTFCCNLHSKVQKSEKQRRRNEKHWKVLVRFHDLFKFLMEVRNSPLKHTLCFVLEETFARVDNKERWWSSSTCWWS